MQTMTYIQAQLYASARNVIARVNHAGTRVWFYTGDEERQSTWLELGPVTLRDGTLDAHAVRMLCDKGAERTGGF